MSTYRLVKRVYRVIIDEKMNGGLQYAFPRRGQEKLRRGHISPLDSYSIQPQLSVDLNSLAGAKLASTRLLAPADALTIPQNPFSGIVSNGGVQAASTCPRLQCGWVLLTSKKTLTPPAFHICEERECQYYVISSLKDRSPLVI